MHMSERDTVVRLLSKRSREQFVYLPCGSMGRMQICFTVVWLGRFACLFACLSAWDRGSSDDRADKAKERRRVPAVYSLV